MLLALTGFAFGERLNDALPVESAGQSLSAGREEAQPEEATPENPADNATPEEMVRVAEQVEDNEPELGTPAGSVATPRKGKWSVSFSLGAFYDNNILISPRLKEDDEIIRAAAKLGFTWGDYLRRRDSFLSVSYSPSGLFFMDHSNFDGFEQTGSLIGQWRIRKFLLGVDCSLETLTGGDIDVGTRTDRTLYNIGIKGKYEFSEKTSFEADFYRDATDYRSSYLSSVEWINQDWVDFQLLPKTRMGLGLVLGDLIPDGSDTQTYEQVRARASYVANEKLTLTADGGWEFRQLGGGNGTQNRPVFNLGLVFYPTEGTRISLEASRRVFSSALDAATNYTGTTFTVNLRQRLQQRLYVSFVGGYEDAKYESASADTTVSRHDRYFFARPGVSVVLNQRANVELYYQYRNNGSSDGNFSFQNNIVGLQATIAF